MLYVSDILIKLGENTLLQVLSDFLCVYKLKKNKNGSFFVHTIL